MRIVAGSEVVSIGLENEAYSNLRGEVVTPCNDEGLVEVLWRMRDGSKKQLPVRPSNITAAPPADFLEGQKVVAFGLEAEDYNGLIGNVVAPLNDRGRVVVNWLLRDGSQQQLAVKPANIRPAPEAPKKAQEAPKKAREAPKDAQEAPKETPKAEHKVTFRKGQQVVAFGLTKQEYNGLQGVVVTPLSEIGRVEVSWLLQNGTRQIVALKPKHLRILEKHEAKQQDTPAAREETNTRGESRMKCMLVRSYVVPSSERFCLISSSVECIK
eukprot:237635-Prorocentrum_minimum.AAC.2